VTLKAVIFDFNGIIINDDSIHQQLIEEILLEENLTLKKWEFQQVTLGRSDRSCFRDILNSRGRIVNEEYLTKLLLRKAEKYIQEVEKLDKLPLYPGLDDLIFQVRSRNLKLGLVSDAIRKEVTVVLERTKLDEYFQVVVTGDDVSTTKPEPDGYSLMVKLLNEKHPDLTLSPQECLAIEDTPEGIVAAKRAGMQVVGVANTYPFHMMQRLSNWAVDYLSDLELERVQEVYLQKQLQSQSPEC
jgi:beta-phosphoglucomutase